MKANFRLGGRMDTLALASIGAAVLTSSPYFDEPPLLLSSAIAALGASWVGYRVFEDFKHDNIIPTKLNLRSSKKLSKKEGLMIGYRTDTGKPVYLSDNMLTRHVLVQGVPGMERLS